MLHVNDKIATKAGVEVYGPYLLPSPVLTHLERPPPSETQSITGMSKWAAHARKNKTR